MRSKIELLQNVPINYTTLAIASDYYKNLGYFNIEVPWIIDVETSLSTSPDGTRGCAYGLDDGTYLVCSAEQGFIKLMKEGLIHSNVNLYSVSPCFRNEPLTSTHSKTFIKLELFCFSNHKSFCQEKALHFMRDANYLLNNKLNIETVIQKNQDGFDICDTEGLELGSYGVRDLYGKYCSYGTGLALPRASIARKLNGVS